MVIFHLYGRVVLAPSRTLEKTFQDLYFKLSKDHKVQLEAFLFFLISISSYSSLFDLNLLQHQLLKQSLPRAECVFSSRKYWNI